MRTIPTAEMDTWRDQGDRDFRVRLRRPGEVAWTNLSDIQGGDWALGIQAQGDTPDQPAGQFTVTFLKHAPEASLSPGISASALNTDAASAFRPFVHPGVSIEIDARTGVGGSWYGWRLWLQGEIEDADWAGDTVTATCLTLDGVIIATQIEAEESRGAVDPGTPVQTEIQGLLTRWLADPPTLRTIGTPDFGIGIYTPAIGSLGAQIRAHAQQRAWDVRYRWSEADANYAYTLYLPPRDKTTPDLMLGADEVFAVPTLRQSRQYVRNAFPVTYIGTDGLPHTVTVTDAASIAEYHRIAMPIVEGTESSIHDATAATALGEYAKSDLSRPLIDGRYEMTFLPWLELHDVIVIQADGDHFDQDRTFAVVGVSHRVDPEAGAWTEVDLRGGTPVGAFYSWHTRAALAAETGEPTVVQAQYASDDVGSNASSDFDPAIHSFARWSTDGGASWTDWFRIVGENGASAAGRYTDYIFKIAVTQPATPTGTAPAGWSDDPPVYDPSTGDKLWASAADRDGLDDSLLSTWSVPVQWSGPKGADGADGLDGSPGLRSNLSNDAHTIPTAADGTGGNYTGADTTISVWLGGVDDSVNWSVTAAKSAGVTGSLTGKTYTVTDLSTDAGWVDLTATRSGYPSLTSRFSLSKAKGGLDGIPGTPGDPGDDATVYRLSVNAAAIKRAADGSYTPTFVSADALQIVGNALPVAYLGRFKFATLSGVTWTTRYTSGSDMTTRNYVPPAGIDAVRVELYAAGGTSVLLDSEIIPIVTDGVDGINGTSALMSVLSNDAHTIPTAADGSGGNFTGASTTLSVLMGGVDDSANWTVTASKSTGVTGSLSGKTYTVTALSTDAGWVDLTATRSGYPSLTNRFSLSKAKGGADGADGDPGDDATVYRLAVDAGAVKRDKDGTYFPTFITADALQVIGNALPVPYAGRFRFSTLSGSTWTDRYTSGSDMTTRNYVLIAGIDAVRVRLFAAGATDILLDEEIVPIVVDGNDGASGSGDPTATITFPYYAPGEDIGFDETATLAGALGPGSAGPLRWRWRYRASGYSAWATTALPVVKTLARHPKNPEIVYLQVQDGSTGPIATVTNTVAPVLSAFTASGALPLSNVSDDAVYRKPKVAFVAADGAVVSIRDSSAGINRSGEELNESYDRAIAGFDASGNVRRAVPRARAAAELPGIDTTTGEVSNVAGTDPAVLVRQALSPSQNRFGQWASKTITTGGTSAGTSTLVEMEIEVGERVSLSALVRRESGTGVPRVRFTFGGAGVSVDVSSTTDAERLVVLEDYEIPVGTTNIGVTYLAPTGGGTTRGRRPMCNLGPRALQYEAPPFRPGRENADDVGDGTSKRVTTTSEATGGGRAIQALDASNRLTDQRRLNIVVSANIACLQSGLSITAVWDSSFGIDGAWKVTVAAHTVRYGFGQVSYSAMTTHCVPQAPGGGNTLYYLYVVDPELTGGGKTLSSTPAAANIIGDGYYRVGEISVPPFGGANPVGTPGGSGAHPIVGA